jgi:peptidyl-prolyl cis-trans isomerase A (cyclophilin A)
MPNLHRASLLIAVTTLSILILFPKSADATVVEFQTVLGNFEVNLYDNATPQTVANFLDYVQTGAYTDSIIHRVSANFIVQGGGVRTDMNAQLSSITANASVINEPVYSNVRGTIAMAKIGGNPNSATSQWFFNLTNNAANLDNQNGGFTVFGEVSAGGMAVIDAIAALPAFPFADPLGELPLQGYSASDFSGAVPLTISNLIIVTAVVVTDSTVDSAGVAGLNPIPTTAVSSGGGGSPAGGGSGGGTFDLLALLSLSLFASRRALR